MQTVWKGLADTDCSKRLFSSILEKGLGVKGGEDPREERMPSHAKADRVIRKAATLGCPLGALWRF